VFPSLGIRGRVFWIANKNVGSVSHEPTMSRVPGAALGAATTRQILLTSAEGEQAQRRQHHCGEYDAERRSPLARASWAAAKAASE
jgi:hypothetical protein